MMDPSPIQAACEVLDLTSEDLWIDFVAVGGSLPLRDIRGFLAGVRPVSTLDYDRLVQALNDHFIEQALDHPLLYSSELEEG